MSAIRRLSAVYRREQRQIRACPYHRSEESLQKEKKASRVRQPSFFSSYLPLIPSQWSSYLGYFNIFNIFGSSKDSKKKEEEDANVVVVAEEDVVMTDSETTTTTEESSSDSSVEIIEVLEAVEPVAPESVRAVEISEPARPAVSAKVSLQNPVSFTPPSSHPRNPPSPSCFGVPSSTVEPLVFSDEDSFINWVKQKADTREKMNNADYLTFKTFIERRRGEQEYEPIKLRFTPREVSPPRNHTVCSVPDVSPSHQTASYNLTSDPAFTGIDASNSISAPSYWSAFHSSTGLPPFKNIAVRSRPRMLKQAPIVPLRGPLEEDRKRSAPLAPPRLDPYKRRRLFEKASSPDPLKSQTSSSNTAGTIPSIPSNVPHTGNGRQHSTPYMPSPLRNVVNGSSPSSRRTNTMPTNLNASGSRSSRSTYSTAFVQEIVEKAPPRPRYSDVANPYQTAGPIKPLTRPMERKKMSDRRARTKELEKQREAARAKELEKKKELSAKEIIEATIPKGAKRSRPPPGLSKSKPVITSMPMVTSKRSLEEPGEQESVTKKRRTVTVEDVPDDDDAASHSVPVRPDVIIESRSPSPELLPCPARPSAEASPPAESSGKVPPARTASGPGSTIREQTTNAARIKDSIPKVASVKDVASKAPSTKEPSLKVPANKESPVRPTVTKAPSAKGLSSHFTPLLNAKAGGKSSIPREPSKLRTSFLPDDYENEEPKVASPTPATTVLMTTPGTPLADIQEKKDPKEVALTLPLNDLPSFIFKTPPTLTAGDHTDARVAAKELPVNSLPKFDFSKARSSMNGMYLPVVPIPTIKPFDFCAAGIKPSDSPSCGQWQCSTCMLQNPAAAVEKCSVCDSPRADMVKPKKVLVNGTNGKDISSRSPTNTSAVKAFDFAAAGFKPDAPVADGRWTCPTCMLQNPPSAVEKCKVCDSPRPETDKAEKPKKPHINGTAHSPSNLTNGVSTPNRKSFDFAAAGVKPLGPPSNGNWQCPTCMLQNPTTATEKCKICDSPRPGPENNKLVSPCAAPAKPPAPVVPKSFDWAAAGMAPKMNGNSWTCGTCMLSNPPTATEKCRVCDASRS